VDHELNNMQNKQMKLAVEENTGIREEFFKEFSSLCANYSSNFTEIGINRNADQLLLISGEFLISSFLKF